jgi:hypothetical protein
MNFKNNPSNEENPGILSDEIIKCANKNDIILNFDLN